VLHYGAERGNAELARKMAAPDSKMSSYLQAK